jgi:hypothetical protein
MAEGGSRSEEAPTEPSPVLDVFCTKIQITDLGDGMRALTCTSPHPTHGGGPVEHRAAIRLIIPAVCLIDIRESLIVAAEAVIRELFMRPGSSNHTH